MRSQLAVLLPQQTKSMPGTQHPHTTVHCTPHCCKGAGKTARDGVDTTAGMGALQMEQGPRWSAHSLAQSCRRPPCSPMQPSSCAPPILPLSRLGKTSTASRSTTHLHARTARSIATMRWLASAQHSFVHAACEPSGVAVIVLQVLHSRKKRMVRVQQGETRRALQQGRSEREGRVVTGTEYSSRDR